MVELINTFCQIIPAELDPERIIKNIKNKLKKLINLYGHVYASNSTKLNTTVCSFLTSSTAFSSFMSK